MTVPSQAAVRYALGAPLCPLVVTNTYNDPVYFDHKVFVGSKKTRAFGNTWSGPRGGEINWDPFH
jgi:hypothetical protein